MEQYVEYQVEEIIKDLKSGAIDGDSVYHKDNNEDICRVGRNTFTFRDMINNSFYVKQSKSETT